MTKYIGALTLSLILSACGQNHQTDIIKGIDGKDGKDGVSCIATDEVVDGVDGQDGKDGVDGADGQDGTNGTNGLSVTGTVLAVGSSACPNGGVSLSLGTQVYNVCNGTQSPTSSTVSTVLLCNKEYALSINGSVYAVMHVEMCAGNGGSYSQCTNPANSKYSNTYLALLSPGQYQTTDGTKCNFTVNADGSISH